MNYEIKKGSAKFLLGLDKRESITAWFEKNPKAVGFAMIGRSNVGKSSLINALLKSMIARVSKTPGRTREINIFTFEIEEKGKKTSPFAPFFLFDLPGYGHAEVSKEMGKNWQELVDGFFTLLPQKILCLNLQDSRHPAQESDLLFGDYFSRMNSPLFLVFNKMDKLKTQKERFELEKLKPKLAQEFPKAQKMFFISAEKKTGLPELEKELINFLKAKV